MRKIFYYFLTIAIVFASFNLQAQLSVTDTSSIFIITFDSTVVNVNNGAYLGTGFTTTPVAGQLNSNAFEVIGMSDGNCLFGNNQTTGDFARGSSTGSISQGGYYSFSVLGSSTFGIQPGGSDFTPGSVTLRLVNNTGSALTELTIGYTIQAYNDENRANNFNFSHSDNNTLFINEPTLNYTSTEAAATTPIWSFPLIKTITLTGLNIPNGAFYYLRWSSDDVSGSGSRDEFALDNIAVKAGVSPDILPPFVVSANVTSPTTVSVIFNEPVGATAEVTANYTGLGTVNTAIRSGGLDSVFLTLANPINIGSFDTLFTANVQDTSGNAMIIPDTAIFLYNNTVADLVISEIMYNNPSFDSLEYLELYNNGNLTAIVGGYTFTFGIDYTFPSGTTIPAGGYYVIAENPTDIDNFYGISGTVGWVSGALNNSGDYLQIENTVQNSIDSVVYQTSSPWPDADGNGYSLVLCNPSLDNSLGANWSLPTNSFVDTLYTVNDSIFGHPLAGCPVPPGDTTLPTVISDTTLNCQSWGYYASEALNASTATNLANYSILPSGPVIVSVLQVDSSAYGLNFNPGLTPLTNYTITISNNVTDLVGNPLDTNISGVMCMNISLNENIQPLQIFPNPSNGIFTLKNVNQYYTYSVFDITGKIVSKGQLNSNIKTIHLSNTPPGIYMLKLEGQQNVVTQKLVIY